MGAEAENRERSRNGEGRPSHEPSSFRRSGRFHVADPKPRGARDSLPGPPEPEPATEQGRIVLRAGIRALTVARQRRTLTGFPRKAGLVRWMDEPIRRSMRERRTPSLPPRHDNAASKNTGFTQNVGTTIDPGLGSVKWIHAPLLLLVRAAPTPKTGLPV